MPSPPKKPINGKSYFKVLCEKAQPILLKDGITLNFDGYEETIEEYESLKENEPSKAWELAKVLNGWSEYFSDIANLIQKTYLDAETNKIEVQSIQSISHNEKSVSAGDRHANTTPEVVEVRKIRNLLKSLYDELMNKIKFLERAYHLCKSTCDWNYKSYNLNKTSGDVNE